MKLQKLETLRLEEFPNLLWLRVHSDAGIVGLGETHRAAPSVEAYVHEFIAPRVLGQDPLEVERLTRSLTGYLGWRGSGVETRAISALDIALWDHYARVVNQPLYQVLGGAAHRAGARRVRHLLARRPDPHGQPRAAEAIRAVLEGAHLCVGNPRRALELQGSAGDRRRRHRDVRPRLVRRHQRRQAHRGA